MRQGIFIECAFNGYWSVYYYLPTYIHVLMLL